MERKCDHCHKEEAYKTWIKGTLDEYGFQETLEWKNLCKTCSAEFAKRNGY